MLGIRKYQEKDKSAVQDICIVNAGCKNKPLNTQRYILIMYCNYYVEQEPDNCFVAVDDDDNAVGYIICAEDYDKYEKVFFETYLPQVRTLGLPKYFEARADLISHELFKKEYPSHLHIDIHPDYQHMGLGSRLMDALTENLASKGYNNVMLVVSATNIQGQNFYKKNGFNDILRLDFKPVGGVAMGKFF